MTPERIKILELMSWWVWDAIEAAWELSFAALFKYVDNHGELPPQSHPTSGKWVDHQRMAYRAWQARLKGEADKYKDLTNVMDEERAIKLESLPYWSWEPYEDNWEANYQALVESYVSTIKYLQ